MNKSPLTLSLLNIVFYSTNSVFLSRCSATTDSTTALDVVLLVWAVSVTNAEAAASCSVDA